MADVIMIGVPGDSKVYIADLKAGTVTAMDEAGQAAANSLRAGDAAYVKGVNFAVAVDAIEPAAAGVFDTH
ncbi:hypothetical protein SAMN05880582_11013 [Rhizobium sp. RU20A]|uniref:hypothetical protein n=1 Tax=Rhizobium sp. RU20A TaxID=1907412 RepID=UPI000953A90E|nr:hypothetical protein [Rhizobium sp. RU20A]SIR31637.1 hypothetical protein SAMN05880582_11013 [Rhizobium sp. RU20A]